MTSFSAFGVMERKVRCEKLLASRQLSGREFSKIISQAALMTERDQRILLLSDLPSGGRYNEDWEDQLRLMRNFALQLKRQFPTKNIELIFYRATGQAGAPLPELAWRVTDLRRALYFAGDRLSELPVVNLAEELRKANIVFAGTRFSATGPLYRATGDKLRDFPLKALSVPGLNSSLLPYFRMDIDKARQDVTALAAQMRDCASFDIQFEVGGRHHSLFIDVQKQPWALEPEITEAGGVDNLPLGEVYVIPSDGMKENVSGTYGILPLQIKGEVILFRVERNRIVEALTDGPIAKEMIAKIKHDPALGNLAEVGFGVLGAQDLGPLSESKNGAILVNEKLGFHIALGRNDYFGGGIGPDQFKKPENVSHVDYVFIPEMQPAIVVRSVKAIFSDGREVQVVKDGKYPSLSLKKTQRNH